MAKQDEINTNVTQPTVTYALTSGERTALRRALEREIQSLTRALEKEKGTNLEEPRKRMIQDLNILSNKFM